MLPAFDCHAQWMDLSEYIHRLSAFRMLHSTMHECMYSVNADSDVESSERIKTLKCRWETEYSVR